MNAKQWIIAGGILAASTSAFADARSMAGEHLIYPQAQPQTTMNKSRADVRAEVDRAYAEGSLARGAAYNYPTQPTKTSMRTRAEVQQEAAQAMQSKEYGFNQQTNS